MSELLTLGEAAERMRCSVRTVKRRIGDGLLPVVVDGALVRVREADLERYLAERLVSRAPEPSVPAAAGRMLEPGARLWD